MECCIVLTPPDRSEETKMASVIKRFIKDKDPLQYMIDCAGSASDFRANLIIRGLKEDCIAWMDLFKEKYPEVEKEISLLISGIKTETIGKLDPFTGLHFSLEEVLPNCKE